MAQQKKWLDSRTEAFSQVPILDDNGISTTEFLNASQSLCIVIGTYISSPLLLCLVLSPHI